MPKGAAHHIKDSQNEQRLIIEYFVEDQLLVNVTKHELVPKHIPLSKQEKKAVLKR